MLEKIKEFIKKYHKENGKVPQLRLIAIEFGIPSYKVVEFYRTLENIGFLKRNYSHYKKIEEPEKQKEKNILKSILVNKDMLILRTIKILALLAGIGAIILSTYFTGEFCKEFLHLSLAYIMSIVIILVSIVSFQVFLFYIENKNNGFAFLSFCIWVLVTFASMGSTVIGQYNKRMIASVNKIEKNIQVNQEDSILKKQEEKKKIIKKQIQDIEKSLIPLRSREQEFNTTEKRQKEWQSFIEVKRLIEEKEKKLEEKNQELLSIINTEEIILKDSDIITKQEVKKESKSFYIWIESIFGLDSNIFEFWWSIIYALIVDLIVPLSIGVCLFLKKRRN